MSLPFTLEWSPPDRSKLDSNELFSRFFRIQVTEVGGGWLGFDNGFSAVVMSPNQISHTLFEQRREEIIGQEEIYRFQYKCSEQRKVTAELTTDTPGARVTGASC